MPKSIYVWHNKNNFKTAYSVYNERGELMRARTIYWLLDLRVVRCGLDLDRRLEDDVRELRARGGGQRQDRSQGDAPDLTRRVFTRERSRNCLLSTGDGQRILARLRCEDFDDAGTVSTK